MDKIILIGAGGHAKACIDIIERDERFGIVGLVDKRESIVDNILGYKVIGTDDDLENLHLKYVYAFVTVGQIKTPEIRISLYNILKLIGYLLPVIISPSAYISKHAICSEGSIIMHGAIVNAGAKIGSNCIINNRSLVDHDAKVGAHCHIATGAILNGGVTVREGSFIGSGTVVKQGINIGKKCVVGAGCVVKTDLPDHSEMK